MSCFLRFMKVPRDAEQVRNMNSYFDEMSNVEFIGLTKKEFDYLDYVNHMFVAFDKQFNLFIMNAKKIGLTLKTSINLL